MRPLEPRARHRTHAPDATHRKRIEKLAKHRSTHLQQTVGLGAVAGDLRHHLDRCDPHRDGESGLFAHLLAQPLPHLEGGAQQPLGTRQVQKGLIQGETLHLGCVAAEDLENSLRLPHVPGHVTAQVDAIGTKAAGLRGGHRRVHSGATRLVAGGRDDSAPSRATHDDRTPVKLRVIALLDGRVEGIHVGVQKGAMTSHPHSVPGQSGDVPCVLAFGDVLAFLHLSLARDAGTQERPRMQERPR